MSYTNCWLEYPLICKENKPFVVKNEFSGAIADSAADELSLGLGKMFGQSVTCGEAADLTIRKNAAIHPEGYEISVENGTGALQAGGERGMLYGVFALLRALRLSGKGYGALSFHEKTAPSNPLRMLNHWDNLDGSIERGYSGTSFFFQKDEIIVDSRIRD